MLWRAGLRIHEALTLAETDLNERRGSLLIGHGKGDRRREVGMDPWAWSVLAGWTAERISLPPGSLFCVIDGPTRPDGRRFETRSRPAWKNGNCPDLDLDAAVNMLVGSFYAQYVSHGTIPCDWSRGVLAQIWPQTGGTRRRTPSGS